MRSRQRTWFLFQPQEILQDDSVSTLLSVFVTGNIDSRVARKIKRTMVSHKTQRFI
uniref:Uncharacterized protein n=1 Tax=Arundo donax TaxID=35708 RepID=A0A0A9Q8X0_ARUDO